MKALKRCQKCSVLAYFEIQLFDYFIFRNIIGAARASLGISKVIICEVFFELAVSWGRHKIWQLGFLIIVQGQRRRLGGVWIFNIALVVFYAQISEWNPFQVLLCMDLL